MSPNVDDDAMHTPNIPQHLHHPASSMTTLPHTPCRPPIPCNILPPHLYPLDTPICPLVTTSSKPRSTRSATKILQEALNENLPVPVKKVKKTPKANKKNKTSADRDKEDKEAEEPSVKTMTATSRILNKSGAALAPLPCQAGTGVLLPPVAPRILSNCVCHPDPGDVPHVVDKGKGRDLTNLGSSDAEDKPEENDDDEDFVDDDEEKEKTSSEEEKEKTLSDKKDSDAGDDQKSGDSADDKKTDSSGEDPMDLDPNVTPCNLPASKPQHSKADHADDTTSLPAPMFANFDDYLLPSSLIADNVDDMQGTSRTMGGFARGKGHGVVPNMADFNTQPADLVPVCNEGRVLVYKNEDHTSAKTRAVRVPLAYTLGPVLKAMVKKMTTLADSNILLWVKDDWEMKGPFAVAAKGDEPIEWNNNKEMELLMERSTQGSGFHSPPSPSVYSAAALLTISSLAPSASVSTADLAIMMKAPFSMTPKASGKGKIPQIFARMKAAALVQDQWLELKNAGKWTGRDLNINKLRLLYICKTNYNTYAKMFENAQKLPILHSLLNDPTYDNNSQGCLGNSPAYKGELGCHHKGVTEQVGQRGEGCREGQGGQGEEGQEGFYFKALVMLLSLWLLLGLLPCVAAAPLEDPFPDILFVDFAKVIKSSFGADVTLATQCAVPTNTQVVTSWMAAFVRAIKDRLQLDSLVTDDDSDAEMNSGSGSGSGSNTSVSSDARSTYDTLFLPTDQHTDQTLKQQTTILGKKLDSFCHFLDLYSHEKRGTLHHKLLPISTAAIQPVLIITPSVMQCSDATCPGHALTQYQCYHDVSKVTMLRGSECFEKVPVLAERCLACSSMFWADHESFNDPANNCCLAVHLPDAKYLKVGTQVWVDRLVSRAIVNANYSFHASIAAVTEFWNYSFAFILESIWLLAEPSGAELLFVDSMVVKDLVTAAYEYLGDGGVIRSAEGHSCNECCHAFKDVADVIPNQPDNPAALAGHDENHAVPEYVGPAVEDVEAMDVDDNVPANDASEPAGGTALNNPADTWCNPAPLNGDAPNLVVVDEDKEGKPYYKRAFNTQACE
ncbi:hypothetical protein BDN71DRAFT_1508969 [Pleurotus eryngii]|uniref:CxC5 like cysteine cluster associated with KDZ domain-containing protein n=1 Tax=Pleurotus eryngii TaxID=5323 RepID=A0A9P5ZT14_PLEER|nr:hypothetical protein BDN71DRAFT_1508969 [Pleurotus eryngii]